MKQQILITVGLAGILSIAACHKKAPAAAAPPPPTPAVAAAPPAPPAAPRVATRVAPNRPAEAARSTTMTPQERATLNERLARLEDALFDYNQATIRTDASTVSGDDVGVVRDILANYPAKTCGSVVMLRRRTRLVGIQSGAGRQAGSRRRGIPDHHADPRRPTDGDQLREGTPGMYGSDGSLLAEEPPGAYHGCPLIACSLVKW